LSVKLTIRTPLDEEKKRFYEVYNTGLPDVDEMTYERFSKSWDANRERGDFEKFWRIAVVDNEIVGVVINYVIEPLKWGMVWELAVVPEHRDKGIGTKLIAESERLLLKSETQITDFAIGVKTHNSRAISLYERLGYDIRFLIVRLRGNTWQTAPTQLLAVRDAENKDAVKLSRLVPDAYWDTSNTNDWKRRILEGGCHVLLTQDDQKTVGIVGVPEVKKESTSTEIAFGIKPGFGKAVLGTAVTLVKTKQVDIWLQDSHQDLIDYAYGRGLKRVESEYLMRKPVGSRKR
jgi:ribosomal protein S18 acetylase RimI-like enzyme